MTLTPDDLTLVKSQAEYHARQVERAKDDIRKRRHQKFTDLFEDFSKRLEQALKVQPAKTIAAGPLGLRIGSMDDLPPEIRDQIKFSDSEMLELDIMQVLESLDGEAAIDEILVGLYRQKERVEDREFLARKLYRMTRTGAIHSTKRKGYFAIGAEASQQDLNFDDEDDEDQTR